MSAQGVEFWRSLRGRTTAAACAALVAVALAAPAAAQEAPDAAPGPAAREGEAVQRTRFYRPPGAGLESGRQPRMIEVGREAPLLVSREERIAAPWIADPEALPVVARVARGTLPGAGGGRLGRSAMRFEEVYLAYAGAPRPAPGDRLLLVDIGAEVGDLGRIVSPRALATVVAAEAAALRLRITDQFGPVMESVVALPFEAPDAVRGETVPVADGTIARLVAFEDESVLHAPSSRAFIGAGSADGVAVGDEFMAYVAGPRLDGGRGQSEPVATLRVIRVEPHSATVRVLNLVHPVLERGVPVVMTRKAPEPAAP